VITLTEGGISVGAFQHRTFARKPLPVYSDILRQFYTGEGVGVQPDQYMHWEGVSFLRNRNRLPRGQGILSLSYDDEEEEAHYFDGDMWHQRIKMLESLGQRRARRGFEAPDEDDTWNIPLLPSDYFSLEHTDSTLGRPTKPKVPESIFSVSTALFGSESLVNEMPDFGLFDKKNEVVEHFVEASPSLKRISRMLGNAGNPLTDLLDNTLAMTRQQLDQGIRADRVAGLQQWVPPDSITDFVMKMKIDEDEDEESPYTQSAFGFPVRSMQQGGARPSSPRATDAFRAITRQFGKNGITSVTDLGEFSEIAEDDEDFEEFDDDILNSSRDLPSKPKEKPGSSQAALNGLLQRNDFKGLKDLLLNVGLVDSSGIVNLPKWQPTGGLYLHQRLNLRDQGKSKRVGHDSDFEPIRKSQSGSNLLSINPIGVDYKAEWARASLSPRSMVRARQKGYMVRPMRNSGRGQGDKGHGGRFGAESGGKTGNRDNIRGQHRKGGNAGEIPLEKYGGPYGDKSLGSQGNIGSGGVDPSDVEPILEDDTDGRRRRKKQDRRDNDNQEMSDDSEKGDEYEESDNADYEYFDHGLKIKVGFGLRSIRVHKPIKLDGILVSGELIEQGAAPGSVVSGGKSGESGASGGFRIVPHKQKDDQRLRRSDSSRGSAVRSSGDTSSRKGGRHRSDSSDDIGTLHSSGKGKQRGGRTIRGRKYQSGKRKLSRTKPVVEGPLEEEEEEEEETIVETIEEIVIPGDEKEKQHVSHHHRRKRKDSDTFELIKEYGINAPPPRDDSDEDVPLNLKTMDSEVVGFGEVDSGRKEKVAAPRPTCLGTKIVIHKKLGDFESLRLMKSLIQYRATLNKFFPFYRNGMKCHSSADLLNRGLKRKHKVHMFGQGDLGRVVSYKLEFCAPTMWDPRRGRLRRNSM
jgi:hypothetical protein